jgi:hypothetical protein
MKETPETTTALPTDVGGTERAGRHAGPGKPRPIDPADPLQVYALALRLQGAGRRNLHKPTHDELQGLARALVLTFPVFAAAILLIEETDAGDAAGSATALMDLIEVARAQRATLGDAT